MTIMQTPTGAARRAARSRRRTWANGGGRAGRISIFDPAIARRAVGDSFRKLDPRVQLRNPVMFVVLRRRGRHHGRVRAHACSTPRLAGDRFFTAAVALWLWFTVLFANFAEAMAEGRGKAQADTLRRTRTDAQAKRLLPNGQTQIVSATELRRGDLVLVEAGDLIPGDGEVVEGVASVNEAAITGESAPVIKEPGTDIRSSVTGGTTIVSDSPQDPHHRQPRRDLHRPHDRPGRGRQPPEDTQRDRAQHPAGLADHHLPAGRLHPAALRHLLGQRRGRDHAGRPAGLPDPHHHRRPALGHRHRRHGPPGAVQRAGHERARRRGRRRRGHAAARQDRHHHLRQPPGLRVHPRGRPQRGRVDRGGAALQPGRRDARGQEHRGPGRAEGRPRRPRVPGQRRAGPLHRRDAHERRHASMATRS